MGRKLVVAIAAFCVVASPAASFADGFSLPKEQRERLIDKLVDMNDSYADVPSSTSCRRPRSPGETIIWKNGNLQFMELYHARGAAYAEENATKSQLNHLSYVAKLPVTCKIEACVADFSRQEADDQVGGDSPYAK